GVGVLHLGRGAGVHRPSVGLVLGGQLPEPVVGVLHLVGDRSVAVQVAGLLVGTASRVEGELEVVDGGIDAGAEGADGVVRQPCQHVQRVAVGGAVLVGEAGLLPEQV